jgi:putative ABC transport system permease protein
LFHNTASLKNIAMFLHYLITAWRNLLKNRIVSIINILGLTLGLASAVIAIAYAQYELSYEKIHEKSDRIAGIYLKGSFGDIKFVPTCFGPEGEAIQNMFPEVEARTISRSYATTVRAGENIFVEDDISFVDSMFFKIFTIPFIDGSPSADPQSVVISKKTAARYFGSENPIGKSLRINCNGEQVDFTVTGIYQDLPSNTIVKADFFIPFSFSKRFGNWKYQEYYSNGYSAFILLRPGTNVALLNEKILKSYKIPVQIDNIAAFLLPLKEIHFNGTFENTKGKLLVFLLGGLFVILISCLNYINLSTILFSMRTKETGIRKVNGARRKHILLQLFTDTLLSTLISFNLAIILIKIILPWFNAKMYTNLQLTSDKDFILAGLALFIVINILSGLYPALRYSAVKPVTLMKPEAAAGHSKSYSRRILTTMQLVLAVTFIQVIMIMDKQGKYMSSMDIKKFDADNVICINGYPWGDLSKVKDELLKNPGIEAVSWGSTLPEMGYNLSMEWKDKDNKKLATDYYFAPDYQKVYSIKLKAGRFLSEEYPSDKDQAVVINERTASELGFTDPLNKQVMIRGKQYTIVGVIDDYMSVPPIMDKMPLLITYSRDINDYLLIRVTPGNEESIHKYIRNTLHKFNADYPVEIKYHDDIMMSTKEAKSYVAASRMMHVFFLLTIINSLIGIFGLSVFIAQRNRKAIGIRKVFGANIIGIMFKHSKGLIMQTLFAIALASPMSYVVGKGYLSVFPQHVHPGILFLLFGGILIAIMLAITVSWQTIKAARTDPARSLRYE